MMAKERPSAMAMPTLAPKPSAGRRRQQPRSPEEGRPGGPRATVMRRRAVDRWVGGARLSVLVVGVDSGGGAVEAGRREAAERGSGSWLGVRLHSRTSHVFLASRLMFAIKPKSVFNTISITFNRLLI